MKKAIIFLLLVLPFTSEAKDILYNRLSKLYAKDQSKCLETAKRYINLFPDNASAYYFASVIYDERSGKSRTVQGKYRNIQKAVGYAISFEEKDNGEMALEVGWDDYRQELTSHASEIVKSLEVAGESKYSDNLLAKLRNLDENVSVVIVTTTVKKSEETPEISELEANSSPLEMVRVDEHSTIRFFGLPRGNELVTSADLEGEQEVLALINEERIRKGMDPLEWNEDLARAARYHAYDLATQDYFDHGSYDRKNGELEKVGGTFERIRKFYSKTFVNSENIAAGNASAEDTYQQWYNSKGHYDNMFNPSSKKVGLGVFYDENSTYGYYWVFCTAH